MSNSLLDLLKKATNETEIAEIIKNEINTWVTRESNLIQTMERKPPNSGANCIDRIVSALTTIGYSKEIQTYIIKDIISLYVSLLPMNLDDSPWKLGYLGVRPLLGRMKPGTEEVTPQFPNKEYCAILGEFFKRYNPVLVIDIILEICAEKNYSILVRRGIVTIVTLLSRSVKSVNSNTVHKALSSVEFSSAPLEVRCQMTKNLLKQKLYNRIQISLKNNEMAIPSLKAYDNLNKLRSIDVLYVLRGPKSTKLSLIWDNTHRALMYRENDSGYIVDIVSYEDNQDIENTSYPERINYVKSKLPHYLFVEIVETIEPQYAPSPIDIKALHEKYIENDSTQLFIKTDAIGARSILRYVVPKDTNEVVSESNEDPNKIVPIVIDH